MMIYIILKEQLNNHHTISSGFLPSIEDTIDNEELVSPRLKTIFEKSSKIKTDRFFKLIENMVDGEYEDPTRNISNIFSYRNLSRVIELKKIQKGGGDAEEIEVDNKEKKDIKMKDMALIELIYPFFAGITPSSLGGESFEIFYMRDCGISIGKGSNITIQKFITYQISLLLINTVAVILNLFMRVVPFNSFIFTFVVINFIVNGILLGFFFLVAYNRKFNQRRCQYYQ